MLTVNSQSKSLVISSTQVSPTSVSDLEALRESFVDIKKCNSNVFVPIRRQNGRCLVLTFCHCYWCSSLFWLGAGLFSVLIYHIVLRLFVYFSLDFTHDLGPSLDLGHINSHHFAVVHIPQRIYTDVQTN